MRRLYKTPTAIVLVVLGLASASPLQAWSPSDFRTDPWGFAAGFAAGIVIHEAGHILVADLSGYSVGHDGLSLVYGGAELRGRDQLRIASAGIQAQWLASEFVFARQRNDASSIGNFGAGLVVSQFAVSLAYLTFLKDHELGDVEGIRQSSGWSRDQIGVSLGLASVLDLWRLSGRRAPRWLPHLSMATKSLMIGAIWSF